MVLLVVLVVSNRILIKFNENISEKGWGVSGGMREGFAKTTEGKG